MSKEVGSLTNGLYAVLELQTTRDDPRLSAFVATSGLFFPTPNDSQPFKPIPITTV